MNHRSPHASEPGVEPGPDLAHAHRMRYQELFEFAADCQLITDGRGVILEANHAAAALFRRPKDFLVGKPLGLLVGQSHRAAFYEKLCRLGWLVGPEAFPTQIGRRGDREPRDAVVRIDPAPPAADDGATYRWTFRDVTEHRRAETGRTELLRRLVTAQEDERKRVSRELHDQLGQDLTSLILGMKELEPELPEGTRGRKKLRELQETVDRLSREAHALAVELLPVVRDDVGLREALETLVRRWSARTGVPADSLVAIASDSRFSPEVEATIYRVVQEALTNVAKHASAHRVSVIVETKDGCLDALIEDDGLGFEPAVDGIDNRLGLSGMKERAALVSGMLAIESSVGVGTTIRLRVPLGHRNGDNGLV